MRSLMQYPRGSSRSLIPQSPRQLPLSLSRWYVRRSSLGGWLAASPAAERICSVRTMICADYVTVATGSLGLLRVPRSCFPVPSGPFAPLPRTLSRLGTCYPPRSPEAKMAELTAGAKAHAVKLRLGPTVIMTAAQRECLGEYEARIVAGYVRRWQCLTRARGGGFGQQLATEVTLPSLAPGWAAGSTGGGAPDG